MSHHPLAMQPLESLSICDALYINPSKGHCTSSFRDQMWINLKIIIKYVRHSWVDQFFLKRTSIILTILHNNLNIDSELKEYL